MAAMKVEMAESGQVTIPKGLCDEYGLRAGQEFTILDIGGVFVLSPRESRVDAMLDRIRDELAAEGATEEEMLTDLRARREASGPTKNPPILG